MKIVSLLENTTEREDIKAEHGLSVYIETARHKILFDMGHTDLFSENAKTLGVDLSAVDLAVLSHGHYDHGGGLRKFLELNDHAPVYIQRDAFLPHYHGTDIYIGLDVTLKDHSQIIFTGDECRIDDYLTLFSCNERERTHETVVSGQTEKTARGFLPEEYRHEQYLLIEEDGKRVLISGCSHKGILDIVGWFSPDTLVGGFHYSNLALDGYLMGAAKELATYPTLFYTCHCTGREQYEFMKQYMPSLHYLSCGQTVIV